MKALILRDDTETAVASAQALMKKGFQVVCVESRHIARALLRIETIDLLVMDERIDGRLTHSIALSAERQNPYINAILMTDRTGQEVDELHDLLPCLYAIAGMETGPVVLAKLAMSSIETYEEAEIRVQRNRAAAAAAQEAHDALIAAEAARELQELREALVQEIDEVSEVHPVPSSVPDDLPEFTTDMPLTAAELPQVGESVPITAEDENDHMPIDSIIFAAERPKPYILEDEVPADETSGAVELPRFDVKAELQHSPAA